MATIFFAWELGVGLGHVMRIAPLARDLAERGHRVFVAARDLWSLEKVMGFSRVQFLPAPFRIHQTGGEIRAPRTFAHILLNIGFSDDRGLAGLAAAWQNLYQLTKPDVIIFDHGPTALLAARAFPARRIVIGTGFCIPPNTTPWPDLRSWLPPDSRSISEDEAQLLRRLNGQLQSWHQRPLSALCQLFADADETFLTTFRELDHYPNREGATYWGPINGIGSGGKDPIWPDVPGKRIYGYLKMFPALPQFLQMLNQSRQPTLIYVDGIDMQIRQRFSSATLRFEQERLDIAKAADRCDLAITNGTFGTTAVMLMKGKPILMLPIALEQLVLATRIGEQGAGMYASTRDASMIESRFRTLLLSHTSMAESASRLASRWAAFKPEQQHQSMLNRIEELCRTV